MCFVYKQSVYAEFLEIDNIIFLFSLEKPVIPELEVGFENLHLLKCPVLACTEFLFSDSIGDGLNLSVHSGKLPFSGESDQLKAAMSHDDGVIFACGNPTDKAAAVLLFKILFLRMSRSSPLYSRGRILFFPRRYSGQYNLPGL